MFIAAFEKNIECLENRFNQNGLEYYEALQQVLILAASKKNYDTELKKILGFYNNERSHDFDEDILKTQLQIFSKNFPLKEQLSIIDIENYFKEMEPSSRKLLSEVGKILELVLVLPATKYSSQQIIPSLCRCSILLSLTFVEIKKSFAKILLIFKS